MRSKVIQDMVDVRNAVSWRNVRACTKREIGPGQARSVHALWCVDARMLLAAATTSARTRSLTRRATEQSNDKGCTDASDQVLGDTNEARSICRCPFASSHACTALVKRATSGGSLVIPHACMSTALAMSNCPKLPQCCTRAEPLQCVRKETNRYCMHATMTDLTRRRIGRQVGHRWPGAGTTHIHELVL